MLSVHGKNGLLLIFLGNPLLKCFLQQSQDIQPYSDNQIKEIEKRCIQNAYGKFSDLCWLLSPEPKQLGYLSVSTVEELSFSEDFFSLSTTAEQLEFIRRKLKVEREIVNQISCLTVGQRNNASWHSVRKGRLTAPSSMLRGLPHPLLSVSWGNMTAHVSKLWHGEINEKKGGRGGGF